MHRDRQHPRLVVEDPLGAVAVVDVEVDVGDALEAGVEQRPHRDRGLVVDAEPLGLARRPVVGAGRGDQRGAGAALGHGPRGRGARRAGAGRVLVHARVRVVVAADAPLARLGPRGQHRLLAVAPHRPDEGRREDPGELLVGQGPGRRLERDPVAVEQARLAAERHGQPVAARVRGVAAAEAHAEPVVVHDQQPQGHGRER